MPETPIAAPAAVPAPPATPPTPARTARPVLFLMSDTGGGHRASAEAVASELVHRHPGDFLVHVLDPFADAAPGLVGRTVRLYSPLIRRAPWAWGALYHATDSGPAVAALNRSVLRLVERGVADMVETLRPAAVVSFHPLLNHVTARVLARTGEHVPFVTVVTDLVDVHASWICPAADAVVTASPNALARCRRAGLPPDRVHHLGLPVAATFTAAPPSPPQRAALRRRLGLREDGFCVLISGGGEGSGGLRRRALALAHSGLDVDVAVICGRNDRLRAQLADARPRRETRLHVRGFVDNMVEWMHAADVGVTKAGPQTIAEALAARLPLLLTTHVPGQERGNLGYVVATGAGRHVRGTRELVDTVAELCAPASPGLAAMRSALGHVARPQAAAETADLIARLAAAR